MSFEIYVPRETDKLSIHLESGEIMFVLGANGSGKSALIHKLYSEHKNLARLIAAHRQIWFPSDSPDLTRARKNQLQQMMKDSDSQPQSRWRDNHSGDRTTMAISSLMDAENVRARAIAGAVDKGDCESIRKLKMKPAPITLINDLLKKSSLPINIFVRDPENLRVKKNSVGEYGASELSDGERNALLIAANVFTAPENSLLIIDEPERHLHRSIISPLLTELFRQRADCAFIVSTHDIALAADHPKAKKLLLRDYYPQLQKWRADIVTGETDIDEDLKRDILGGRQILLFVEGNEGSLDKLLYSRLFPQVSVIPKSTCGDVERAVRGIRGAKEFHWLHVFGIVDKDQRSDEDIRRLKEENIYAVPFVSVEAIFYHPEIQTQMARQQGESLDMNWEELLEKAKTDSILAVTNNEDHLVKGAVEARIRSMLMAKLPTRKDVTEDGKIELEISFKKEIVKEKGKLEELCKNQNFEGILESYPIRESAALDKIAQALRYQRRKDYESAVLARLSKDEETLSFVRSLFGDLASQMESAASPASATSSS